MRGFGLLGVMVLAAAPLVAQDTVRVGVTYRPGVRPGVIVFPAAGLDSIQAIVARHLDYSDRLAHKTFRYSIVYLSVLFAALLVDHYFRVVL